MRYSVNLAEVEIMATSSKNSYDEDFIFGLIYF